MGAQAQVKSGNFVVNIMLMVDETSTFVVPHLLHRLKDEEH